MTLTTKNLAWQPATSTAIIIPDPLDPAVHLPILAQAGLKIIELNCYDEQCFPWENPAALRELAHVAQDQGITIYSMHPPDRGSLASPDPQPANLRIDTLKRSIDTIAQLGGSVISFHAGDVLDQGPQRADATQRITQRLAQIAEHAQKAKIIAAVETSPCLGHEWTNNEMLDIVQTLDQPGIGIVIDSGHSHIAGDLIGFAQKAGPKLVNLHLHDNDGQHDQHNPPGTGTIDWPTFINDLRAANYQGPLMLETVPANYLPKNTTHQASANFCRQALKDTFNV